MAKHKLLAAYCLNQEMENVTSDDALRLTHLNISAGLVKNGVARTASNERIAEINRLREYNPDLKCSACFGGKYSQPSSTAQGREKLAESFAVVTMKYDLDGIDLDWEYPCCVENGIDAMPEDRGNFTLLCEQVRKALDGISGRHRLLTIAAGADQYFVDSTEMSKVQSYLDYVYLMTYDLRGAFQALTGHHTNLYSPIGDVFTISADMAAKIFVKAGVPKEKIAIGMAFYSRMWDGIRNFNNGYLQIAKTRGHYGPVYHELLEDYIDKNGYTKYWDDVCKAPYLFNGSSFISYDDERSIACKCGYVMDNGYAGVFYWEHSGDKTRTLLKAAYEALNDTSPARKR